MSEEWEEIWYEINWDSLPSKELAQVNWIKDLLKKELSKQEDKIYKKFAEGKIYD